MIWHRKKLSIYVNLRLLFVSKSLSVSCLIIWKGAKRFSEFVCDSVDFILIIFQGGVIWVYWDFVVNCVVQELAVAPISKQKWKQYCKKMEVYIENNIRYTCPFIFSWFQRKMQGFISFDFISEETLFTSPFSRMGLGLAMCADGGTIYFYVFSVQVFNSVAGKLWKFSHRCPPF